MDNLQRWGNAYMDGIGIKGGAKANWATTSGTFYWPITEMQFFGYTDDVTYTAPASSNRLSYYQVYSS